MHKPLLHQHPKMIASTRLINVIPPEFHPMFVMKLERSESASSRTIKRLKILGLVACAAAAFVPPAFGDTYRFLSRDDEGAATFIDESSINRVADTVTIWTLTITGDFMKGRTPKVAYYLMHNSFNCRTQRFRAAAMSTYNNVGTPVVSDESGTGEGPIEPGTIEQELYKQVCLKERSKNGSFEGKSPFAVATDFRNEVLALKK